MTTDTTNKEAGALKPCPFCGNMPFVAEEMDPDDWWYVACQTPGCILPFAAGHTSIESAIAKWNRRAPAEVQAEARFDAVDLILRDVCETDPANPDLNDTVCIDISDLKTIVERHIGAASLLDWAVERWNAEVANRPLANVHRRSLDDTWRQVIRHCGGDPDALLGPSHSELIAAPAASGGERS